MTDKQLERLAERIKLMRKAYGLKQKEVTKIAGFNIQLAGLIERNQAKGKINKSHAVRLAEMFGVSYHDFMNLGEEELVKKSRSKELKWLKEKKRKLEPGVEVETNYKRGNEEYRIKGRVCETYHKYDSAVIVEIEKDYDGLMKKFIDVDRLAVRKKDLIVV